MSKNNIVIFGGDIAPTPATADRYREKRTDIIYGDVADEMRKAGNVIVNLETALTEKNFPIRKHGPNIKGPVEMAAVLKDAGVTACGMANNHIFDFGITGLRDTFAAVDEQGMDRFGCAENEADAVKPYFFTAGDKKIGVIAVVEHEYTYADGERPGAAPFDPFDTMVRIRDTKAVCDYLVVMYHGGKEQCEYPSPRLYKACHTFVEFGADIVLCQHSHIIGTYEYYKDAFILYGQGNFNFVRYHDLKGWTTGLMLKVTFDESMKIEMIPLDSGDEGMHIARGEVAEKIMNGLEERSKSLRDGTWIDGWNQFVEENKQIYIEAVSNAGGHGGDPAIREERFAHYLDCEAHTDVWRTLFKTWHATGMDDGLREE